jgi:hypothetical protein
MLDIRILTIPHEKQRYNTVGDWVIKGNTLYIFISSMNDYRVEGAVAVHELSEYLMCKHKGITPSDVDQFDLAFEANRKPGDISEPGDDSSAPYKNQHFVATTIERLLIPELDLNWREYEETINSL